MTVQKVLLRLATFGLVLASAYAQTDATAAVEHRTAELMEQILAAVSTKDDGTDMQRLCGMVNNIEASVIQMGKQEATDSEYALAHLGAELEITKANLTAVRIEYNLTASALRAHEDVMKPLPQQFSSVKAREEALLKQRELLSKECEQDAQGQRFRVDAVKSDLSILDEALKHLQSLQHLVGSEASAAAPVSLIEVAESVDLNDPKCVIPQIPGPIVQCQNGYYIPLSENNGSISTLPPGNGMAYSQRLKCGFRIAPAGASLLDRVELTFHYFETVKDVDFVEVYDGDVPSQDRLLVRFSGRLSPPPSVRSNSPDITVLFVTGPNSVQSSPGFLATYKALRIPTTRNSAINLCSGTGGVPLVLTGQSGFVAEDSRPEFADAIQNRAGTAYGQSVQCAWSIHTLPGESVRLHFTFLNTEPNADFVTVYDGDTTHAPVLLRTSGSTVPSDIFSSASSLLITYSADYTIKGNGFSAAWCVNGTSCPDNTVPQLPSPAPVPSPFIPNHNASAPLPALISPIPSPLYTPPPEYPAPATAEHGSCCPSDCSRRGYCNPVTCFCACFTGYSGSDCSVAQDISISASNNLLEMESGVGLSEEASMFHGERMEDECGDDVEQLDPSQAVKPLNLDPVTSLLERLKFELYRSLAYEHDTTNITKRECNDELKMQDKDLHDLQLERIKLGTQLDEMNTHAKSLIEKRDSLYLAMTSYQTAANDILIRIENSKSARETREKVQTSELKTLQGMRDLITHIGQHPCTRDVKEVTVFNQTANVECFGELLETELHTDDAEACKPVCGFGCVGFTFHSHEGCKFFSAIRTHTSQCAGGTDASCSCFEKA